VSDPTSGLGSYDDLPDGVLVADDTGVVVLLNGPGARLLGRDAADCIGRSYREVLPLVDVGGNDWWSCADPYDGLWTRTRQPERQLSLVKGHEPGDAHELLVTARYVRGADRRVVRLVVCFRDAAARERVDRSRADLISTVAHELRSPLTSVKGFTATLLAKWDRFNDEQKKVMLQTVNSDADRVTRLLTDLLDVSRIDAGRLELRRQVVDVPAAIRRAFAGRVAAGAAESSFTLDVAGELPEMWLDPDKLDQILGNLLENALKYGDGTISVTVHGTAAGAEIVVSDEGEGIPEDVHSRVFSKFWRQADGGRRKGTGLGLFITKGLVEVHGGHISVGRAASGGAEFRFSLPAGVPTYEG